MFLIVIVSRLTSPTQIVDGLNALLIVGAGTETTFNVALAGVVFVIFVPPPVELKAPAGIVLMKFPEALAVTSIDTVHEPGVIPTCAGTVPPLSEKVVCPATAVTEPPHELEIFGGVAMTMPG